MLKVLFYTTTSGRWAIHILGYNYVTCRPVSTYWVSSVHGRQSKKYTQNVKYPDIIAIMLNNESYFQRKAQPIKETQNLNK